MQCIKRILWNNQSGKSIKTEGALKSTSQYKNKSKHYGKKGFFLHKQFSRNVVNKVWKRRNSLTKGDGIKLSRTSNEFSKNSNEFSQISIKFSKTSVKVGQVKEPILVPKIEEFSLCQVYRPSFPYSLLAVYLIVVGLRNLSFSWHG